MLVLAILAYYYTGLRESPVPRRVWEGYVWVSFTLPMQVNKAAGEALRGYEAELGGGQGLVWRLLVIGPVYGMAVVGCQVVMMG